MTNKQMITKCPRPECIKSVRKRIGGTMSQCASMIGVSVHTWPAYESGRNNMNGIAWRLFLLKSGVKFDKNLIPDTSFKTPLEREPVFVLYVDREITGSIMRSLRVSMSLSQKDFAKIIGVSKNTVGNYEKGNHKLPLYLQEFIWWLINKPEDTQKLISAVVEKQA